MVSTTPAWSEEIRRRIRAGRGPQRLLMHANESPWDLPPALKAEILGVLADVPFSRYDYALRPLLLERLSAYTGVPAEQIIPGNGADELIQLCAMSLPAPDGRVVICGPTFVVYGHAAAALRRPVVNVPLRDPDFSLDDERLVGTVRRGDLVFLCRPNNPTGNLFPRDQVLRSLDRLEEKGARLVVDEAYSEFARQSLAGEVTSGARSGLVVLRTMSKAFRLAGLRIGYALASPSLVARMDQARLVYNLSAASIAAAIALLARPGLARRTAATLCRLRDRLAEDLGAIPGVAVYPSETNFLLVRVPRPAVEVHREMARQGVFIRHYPAEDRLADCVRVSVGSRRQNRVAAETMRRVLGPAASPKQETR